MDLMNVPAKVDVRSFTRSWDNRGYLKNFGQSMDTPFKVAQGRWFWCQSKARIYDFLLVRNSNLGPILHRIGDIAGFWASEWPHPYFTPILGMFPLHQLAHVGVSPRISRKLFGREIVFEEFQLYVITVSKLCGLTDGQTDGHNCVSKPTVR